MQKQVWLVAALAVSSALCAQENYLSGEDVLAAFQQYNPSALAKATENPVYRDILQKLVAAYHQPRTQAHEDELVALVKNFDNSIRRQALREAYFEGRTLQEMTGADLAALDQATLDGLVPLVEDILQQTLDVREMQLARQKQQLRQTKKNKTLSAEAKAQAVAQLQAQIRQTRQEIRSLKQDARQKVRATAEVYLADMRAEYEAALPRQLQAQQSAAYDIKANHKKPVAE